MKWVTTRLFVSLLRAVNAKFRSDKPPQLQDLRVTEETELEAKD